MCILCEREVDISKYKTSKIEIGLTPNITICLDHIAMYVSIIEQALEDINDENIVHLLDLESQEQKDIELAITNLIKQEGLAAYWELKSDTVLTDRPKTSKELKSLILEKFKAILNNNTDVEDTAANANVLTNPKEVKAYLDDYVVGQDIAKKALAVALCDHYRRIQNPDSNMLRKSNVLVIGPSGSGKTLLCEKLAELLKVPFVSADASSLTAEGYVGSSPQSILETLYYKAGENLDVMQNGIIYLDEIDKIAGNASPSGKDVGGRCVQEQLLRMLQGDTVTISVGHNQAPKRQVQINTKNILFICSGAFEGLDKIMNKKEKKSIGFANSVESLESKPKLRVPSTSDLIEYGMDRQFLGRFSVITAVEQLTETELRYIITKPKDAILKEYQSVFALEDIKLKFTTPALEKVAKVALEENVGARGIRRLMEGILQPYKFDIMDYKEVKEIKIGKKEVEEYIAQNQVG